MSDAIDENLLVTDKLCGELKDAAEGYERPLDFFSSYDEATESAIRSTGIRIINEAKLSISAEKSCGKNYKHNLDISRSKRIVEIFEREKEELKRMEITAKKFLKRLNDE